MLPDNRITDNQGPAVVKLTQIFHASFRLFYVPLFWKVAEVVMIAKPPAEVSSYRPNSKNFRGNKCIVCTAVFMERFTSIRQSQS